MNQLVDSSILENLEGRDFSDFLSNLLSRRQIEDWLENQTLTADTKALLAKVVNLTVTVGSTVISVGRKLLSSIAHYVSEFRGIAFGVVVGAILSFLVGSIPLVGFLLGPLVSPILLAFGVSMGAVQDFSAMRMKRELEILKSEYEILKA